MTQFETKTGNDKAVKEKSLKKRHQNLTKEHILESFCRPLQAQHCIIPFPGPTSRERLRW
jgi:hypothetical protein